MTVYPPILAGSIGWTIKIGFPPLLSINMLGGLPTKPASTVISKMEYETGSQPGTTV